MEAPREVMQVVQFIGRIERAQLGGLRHGQHFRLGEVQVAATRHAALYLLRVHLGVRAAHEQHLGAVGIEFRGAAFISFDVCEFVADDTVIGLAHAGEREGIRRSAVEGKENIAIDLEEPADQVAGLLGPAILAVARGITRVRLLKRLPGFGRDTRAIVTCESVMYGHISLL